MRGRPRCGRPDRRGARRSQGSAPVARWGDGVEMSPPRQAGPGAAAGAPRDARVDGSELAFPLLAPGDRVLGTLVLDRGRAWTGGERAFLESAARSLAGVLA